jgi:hypothetical protein
MGNSSQLGMLDLPLGLLCVARFRRGTSQIWLMKRKAVSLCITWRHLHETYE